MIDRLPLPGNAFRKRRAHHYGGTLSANLGSNGLVILRLSGPGKTLHALTTEKKNIPTGVVVVIAQRNTPSGNGRALYRDTSAG